MALAACPVARIPHNLVDDRYDEARCCSLPSTRRVKPERACVTRAYTRLLDSWSTLRVASKQWRRNKRKP